MLPCMVRTLKKAFSQKRAFSFHLLLIFICCLAPQSFAQYQFDVWNSENGLPQNSVNAILQTRDGYLWFATFDGLVRYDGIGLEIFDKGNTEGILSNRFSTLFEDRQGIFWMGTEDGMLTKYQNGKFHTYSKNDGLLNLQIFKIEEDERGRLWLVTSGGLTLWENNRAIHYEPKDFAPAIKERWRRMGNLWWCQDINELHILTGGRVIHYSKPQDLAKLHIEALYEDQYGIIWMRTTENILVKLQDGKVTFYPLKNRFPNFQISATACQDRKGNIWLETYVTGESQDRISCLKDGLLTRYGQSHAVMAIYEDREGTIWIGTVSGGVYRVREHAVTMLSEKDGLSFNHVYSVFEDSAGAVWAGTWGGGLNCYKDHKFTHYAKQDGFFSDRVTTIFEDKRGVLWVGTDGGMSCFKNGRFIKYMNYPGLPNVWAMCEDRAGNLWFGTDAGLICYRNGSFTTYRMNNGLPGQTVNALLEDHLGNLWIGTTGGLACFTNGNIVSFTVNDGLSGNRIRSLYEDAGGAFWIGTYDSGLTRLKDGRFTRYTVKEGLFNNGVFQILEDVQGNFWLTCNRGIYRVSKQELNDFAEDSRRSLMSVAYGAKDGLLKTECNGDRQPAGWKMRDGKLWFPTMGGIAIIDPDKINRNPMPPPLVIQEVRLNNEPVELSHEIRIPSGTDNLEIHYAGLSFIKPEQVKFKYKLEGSDKDWIEAGDRRAAYYNYISPGEYTFTVIAANSDGIWNQTGQSLRVIVLPQWYEKRWFQVLSISGAVLGLLTALWLWQKRRIAGIEKDHARQQVFSRKLIQSQENERKKIAAKLHGDFIQILLMIDNWAQQTLKKLNDEEQIQKRLERISEAALQGVTEVRRTAYDLRPPLLDSLGLTEAINAILTEISGSSGIRFSWSVEPIDGLFSKEDNIHVYRIVQESINNILRHSKATEAMVTIRKNRENVSIEIIDNGCGFEACDNNLTGMGLQDIAERTRNLNGDFHIQSFLRGGTRLMITLTRQGEHDE
jgi:ligand-binding sensor domain-containing protein/signal transduction histidine kinase